MRQARSKTGWTPPREGGYSAKTAGRSEPQRKPPPPKGRGSASEPGTPGKRDAGT